MARKFFFVCAGLLCLAIAYDVGVKNATAQTGLVDGAHVENDGPSLDLTAAIGRQFYRWRWDIVSGQITPGPVTVFAAPIPGTAQVVSTFSDYYGRFVAVLGNGDTYYVDDGSSWKLAGNFAGSPTPAQKASWGHVKARYR